MFRKLDYEKKELQQSLEECKQVSAAKDITIQALTKDVEYRDRELETVKKGNSELKELAEKSIQQQVAAIKAQIVIENEKALKAREEELSRHAKESMSTIAGDFNKNLKDMRDAFEANKKTQNDTSSELRTQIGEAVKSLRDQTKNVGDKADRLASVLKGQNKMQGCWGETQLNNILIDEGLVEGRDFERESTLRDDLGLVIHNEDSGKKMRPDFILHYPDNTDIVIDCKVSLNALSDYFAAETDSQRTDAAQRNLRSIKDQVDNLSKKDYSSYLRTGRKCLDYTIMFVPNVNALVLARQLDSHIITDSFRKNVLIASEETLMPILRLVRTAWINFDQARNQEKIVEAATRMIERVGDFCKNYAEVGKKLDEARKVYDAAELKLREGGQSIVKAAHDVTALGIKAKKEIPPVL